MLVTRPTLRGSRIAQPVWTSNAEIAHADMYNDKAHLLLVKKCTTVYNIPRRHLPLLCFWQAKWICEIPKCQRQKRSKRLFLNICLFPPTLRLSMGLPAEETLQSYEIIPGKENINARKSKKTLQLKWIKHSKLTQTLYFFGFLLKKSNYFFGFLRFSAIYFFG